MWQEAEVVKLKNDKVLIHYNNWDSKWDEWIPLKHGDKFAPFHRLSVHGKQTKYQMNAEVAIWGPYGVRKWFQGVITDIKQKQVKVRYDESSKNRTVDFWYHIESPDICFIHDFDSYQERLRTQVKVPNPKDQKDGLGSTPLEEPASQQSDPAREEHGKRHFIIFLLAVCFIAVVLLARYADLHFAASRGDLTTMNLFAVTGAIHHSLNSKDSQGNTPLHLASIHGQVDAIKHLLHFDPDLNALNGDRYTPLCVASERENIDSMQLIQKAGARLNTSCGIKKQSACEIAKNLGLSVSFLYLQQAEEKSRLMDLAVAAQDGDLVSLKAQFRRKICGAILEFDPDSAPSAKSQNALHVASKHGHKHIVEHLVKIRKYDINVQEEHTGYTPLMLATFSGHLGVVRYLVDAGAKLDLKSGDGLTVKKHAIKRKQSKIMRFLKRIEGKLKAIAKEREGIIQEARAMLRKARKISRLVTVRFAIDMFNQVLNMGELDRSTRFKVEKNLADSNAFAAELSHQDADRLSFLQTALLRANNSIRLSSSRSSCKEAKKLKAKIHTKLCGAFETVKTRIWEDMLKVQDHEHRAVLAEQLFRASVHLPDDTICKKKALVDLCIRWMDIARSDVAITSVKRPLAAIQILEEMIDSGLQDSCQYGQRAGGGGGKYDGSCEEDQSCLWEGGDGSSIDEFHMEVLLIEKEYRNSLAEGEYNSNIEDLLWSWLDGIIATSREAQLRANAHARIGRIFWDLNPINGTQISPQIRAAKSHFQNALMNAEGKEEMFPWVSEVEEFLRTIEGKEANNDIETKIEMLGKHEKPVGKLLNYIYHEHPPPNVSRERYHLPGEHVRGMSKTERGCYFRSLLPKVIAQYHPDKVSSAHGKVWKRLATAISKLLNGALEFYRGECKRK